MQVILWKLWSLAFLKGYAGVPWTLFSICLLLFVSLFLALVVSLAIAIDMLRLVVCWNDIDSVVVWCVSPSYVVIVDSSLRIASMFDTMQ